MAGTDGMDFWGFSSARILNQPNPRTKAGGVVGLGDGLRVGRSEVSQRKMDSNR